MAQVRSSVKWVDDDGSFRANKFHVSDVREIYFFIFSSCELLIITLGYNSLTSDILVSRHLKTDPHDTTNCKI